jgi:hypothetical protein
MLFAVIMPMKRNQDLIRILDSPQKCKTQTVRKTYPTRAMSVLSTVPIPSGLCLRGRFRLLVCQCKISIWWELSISNEKKVQNTNSMQNVRNARDVSSVNRPNSVGTVPVRRLLPDVIICQWNNQDLVRLLDSPQKCKITNSTQKTYPSKRLTVRSTVPIRSGLCLWGCCMLWSCQWKRSGFGESSRFANHNH